MSAVDDIAAEVTQELNLQWMNGAQGHTVDFLESAKSLISRIAAIDRAHAIMDKRPDPAIDILAAQLSNGSWDYISEQSRDILRKGAVALLDQIEDARNARHGNDDA